MSLRQSTGTASREPALSHRRFPSAWLQGCRLHERNHGGKGYLRHSPIARLYADAPVQRIYSGFNEVMKALAARQL